MTESHVVSALKAKRAEIAGKIEYQNEQVRQLVIDLDHIDATLRLYVPDIDLEDIRPKPMPPRYAAFRGEVMRIVLETLRNAKGPLTSRDLAAQVMVQRGLNPEHLQTLHTFTKRVGAAMNVYRERGLVTGERVGQSQFIEWRLAG